MRPSRSLPVPTWVRTYDRRDVRADLVGGLVTSAVVIPQAIAYASLAGLSAEVGLYTCMVPGLAYALLGGSRTLSMTTTSTVASLTGSALLVSSVAGGHADPKVALATLTVLVGVILLVARVLRLGVLVESISGATLLGVQLSVGLTIIAGEVPELLGVPGDPDADALPAVIAGVIGDLDRASATTVALSMGSLALLIGVRATSRRALAPIAAALGGIALVVVVDLDDHGVALVAPVPAGLPSPHLPALDLVGPLLPAAGAIALMCFLETAAVATSSRRRGEPPIDHDRELVANGVASATGGLVGAMPAAGGFSQTLTNRGAGARTQLSGVVVAVVAVVGSFTLTGVLGRLPRATLSAIVVVAVAGLVRPDRLVRYRRHSRIELWIALTTAVAGLLWGLLVAVLAGVLNTFLLVLHELGRVEVSELQPTLSGDDVESVGERTQAEPGLLILKVDGPLFTVNVRRVHALVVDRLEAALREGRAVDTVVVDVGALWRVTYTVLDVTDDLDRALGELGAQLWLAGGAGPAAELSQTTEWWPRWQEAGRIHPTSLAALHAHRRGA